MKIYALLTLISFSLFAQDEESEALRTMRISCEKQKIGLACFNYANMLIRAEKNETVDNYFEMGCKLDHSPSCKKEKWVIPDVVIVRPAKKEAEDSSSDSETFSAFDIKAPEGSPASSSSGQQNNYNSPSSYQSNDNGQSNYPPAASTTAPAAFVNSEPSSPPQSNSQAQNGMPSSILVAPSQPPGSMMSP
jgi:hypothetical protein